METARSKNSNKIDKHTNKSNKNKTVRSKNKTVRHKNKTVRGKYAIPKKFMKGLKNITRKITKKSSSKSNECSICLEKMEQNNIVVLPFPCGHKFHFTCIFTELTKTNGQGTCPLCRRKVVPAPTTTNPSNNSESEDDTSTVSNLLPIQTNNGQTLYYDENIDRFYLDDGTLIDSTYEELLLDGTIQDDTALNNVIGNIFYANITELPTVRLVGNNLLLHHDQHGFFGDRGKLYHADGTPIEFSFDEMVDRGFI